MMITNFFSVVMRRAQFAVALLLAAGHVSAMGLMSAYEGALQHDPVYLSAVAENQAGQEYQTIGRAGLLPRVEYNYGNSKNKAALTMPGSNGLPVTTHPEYTSISNSISLRQTLFNLETFANYRQGIAQTNFSDAQFVGQHQDLILRLVMAYTEASYAQDQLLLLVAQRDALAEQKRANQMMFQYGEGSKTDVLETGAKLDVAQAQLFEAQDQLVIARNTLTAMTGQDVNYLDGLDDDFKVQPLALSVFEDWQKIAINNNVEIVTGQFALASAEEEINKSLAGHAPRVELNVTYSRSNSETLTTYQQDSTQSSIGVQLVVPLYSGGRVSAVTRQSEANRDKVKFDLEATTSMVMIELRKQFNAARSSVTRMDALQKSVNSATLLVQATKESVKGGVRINLDVLNTQQQLVAAKRDLAQARYNYLMVLLKLRMAAGILGADDLRTVAYYFTAEH
jgi:protease secretion system outer membrane protein